MKKILTYGKIKAFPTAPVYSDRRNHAKTPHISHAWQSEVQGLSFSLHPAMLVQPGAYKQFTLNLARLSLAAGGLMCAKHSLAHASAADTTYHGSQSQSFYSELLTISFNSFLCSWESLHFSLAILEHQLLGC